jgi:threonine dehydratase
MRLLLERAHLVVEPSGAAALAAYLFHPDVAATGTTCVILSGGNVDVARLTALLAGR